MRGRRRNPSIRRTARRLAGEEAGYVLMWVIFGFVVMGSVATAALLSAGTERQSAKAVADWGTSLYLAETGMQEIMGAVTDSALDLLLPGDSIQFAPRTLAQGGSYSGVLHRVDDDRGQRMYSIQVEGRRGNLLSGVQHIAMVATRAGPPPGAAVAVAGDLTISGNPVIKGTCGGLSVGGRLTVTGDLTIDGEVAAREIVMTGAIRDSAGTPLPRKKRTQPPAPTDVPVESAEEECDENSVVVEDGGAVVEEPACAALGTCTEADKLAYYAALDQATEVKYDPGSGQYAFDGAGAPSSPTCFDGSVTIAGDVGTPSTPQPIAVTSEGSVEITGNPYIEAVDPDKALIHADGDLKLAGNSTLDDPNFTGDIYAASQCEITGAPAVAGQIVCGGEPNPSGVPETVLENRIDGDLSIRYDCPAGGLTAGSLRPIQKRAWRQIY